jgi:hypothetical protein
MLTGIPAPPYPAFIVVMADRSERYLKVVFCGASVTAAILQPVL